MSTRQVVHEMISILLIELDQCRPKVIAGIGVVVEIFVEVLVLVVIIVVVVMVVGLVVNHLRRKNKKRKTDVQKSWRTILVYCPYCPCCLKDECTPADLIVVVLN